MAHIVPSDVANLIREQFTWVSSTNPPSGASYSNIAAIAGLLEIAERIPEKLLMLSSQERRDYLFAISSLRHLVKRLENGVSSAGAAWPWPTIGHSNALTRLWSLIAQCPDEAISERTTKLLFIEDLPFRDNLRLDISSAESALSNGEWKAATVLSGCAIEALLLHAILKSPESQRANALETARNRSIPQLSKLDHARPDEWSLSHYIEVALELKLIEPSTASAARLAKDFRNLIHPGREIRKKQTCDRGTALSAVAALFHVTRDIERNV